MKFQIGDKVLILHSNEEGEVVDIINNKMVMVDVRGVRFPAYNDQLDFPYFKRFTEKKLFPEKQAKKFIDEVPKEKKKIIEKIVDGIWLTFIPVMDSDEFGDEIVEELKIHLVNKTASAYKFKYSLSYSGQQPGFEIANQIHPFEDFYVHDIPFENFNDGPVFSLEFSLVTPDKKKSDYFETSLKLKPKQVFTRIEELKKKGEATFSYKLLDTYPDKTEEMVIDTPSLSGAGFRIYEVSQARQHLEPAKYELDLHVEKLTDNWKSMDNFEKLTLQLKTFEKYLDLAIAHHQHTMIAIHGIGSGKLRDEIHEILRLKRAVKSFVNQYNPAYGYGATEIYFQY
ncbi:MAG: Smr/MutS family protein [Chitinophagaceae bacterium]|nr:Smr/MutS family protein [Chitinophagaceae bacterium]